MNRIKKALTGVVTMMLALTMMVMPVSAAGFSDTAEHWAKENIGRWAEASVLNGKPSGNFEPEAYITRAEVAKVMSVMLGLSEKPVGKYNTVFKDVPADAWYYHYVMACADAGIINGKGEGMYAPDANITREEAFKLIMCGLLGEENIVEKQADGTVKPKSEYAKNSKAILSKFSDYNKVVWSAPYLAEIVGRGAVNGDDKNKDGRLDLRPQDNITRAEVTKILDCLVAIYITADGTVSEPSKAAKGWDEKTQEFVQEDNQVGTFVVVHDAQEGNWVIQNETDGNITITNTDSEKDIKVTVKVSNTNKSDDVVVKQGTTCVEVTEEEEVIIVPEAKPVDPEKPSTPSETPCSHVYVKDDSKCTDCTKDREVKATCSNCGASFVYETIKAHGHTYENGKCTCCGKAEPVTHTCVFEHTNCAITEIVLCECGADKKLDAEEHEFVDGTCTECGMTEEDTAMKFHANVTSHGNWVDVNVTNDYVAKVEVTPGEVDAAKVTATVEMQNVGGLGVTGKRSETKNFETGLTGSPELKTSLSNAFDFGKNKDGTDKPVTTIYATVDGQDTDYTVKGSTSAEGFAVLTATPANIEDTRTAWEKLTSHVTTSEQTVEDSYILIANGSQLRIGDDKLSFEKGLEEDDKDLKLDGFSTKDGLNNLQTVIREKVQLNTNKLFEHEVYEMEFYLAAGTELAVGNSIATLDDNCLITIDADKIAGNENLDKILTELQGAEGGYDMAKALVRLLNEVIGEVDGETIYVNVTFEEPEEEKETKFYFGMTANNADGKGTTTVDMEVFDDYSVEMNLPMNDLKANEITLEVAMNDVASLGCAGESKYHSQKINTGIDADGKLTTWMSNAPEFTNATIHATIVDLNNDSAEVEYYLESDMDADWVTVTGTADEDSARNAWKKLTQYIESGSNPKGDNSYITVNNGSYVQVGKEKLEFEDGADDMLLDNFSDLDALKNEITGSVKLVEATDDKIVLYVGKGTTLAVSESYATLTKDAEITVSVTGNTAEISDDTLSKIRDAANNGNYALVQQLFITLNDMIGAMNGAKVDVEIKFIETPVLLTGTLEETDATALVVEEFEEEPVVEEEPTTVDTVSGSNLDV